MPESSTASVLCNLPIELREMIYDYVFTGTIWPDQNSTTYPVLLCANKEIRRKAPPRFYKTATFRFVVMDSLFVWVHSLPAAVRGTIGRVDFESPRGYEARELAAETRYLNFALDSTGAGVKEGMFSAIDPYADGH